MLKRVYSFVELVKTPGAASNKRLKNDDKEVRNEINRILSL